MILLHFFLYGKANRLKDLCAGEQALLTAIVIRVTQRQSFCNEYLIFWFITWEWAFIVARQNFEKKQFLSLEEPWRITSNVILLQKLKDRMREPILMLLPVKLIKYIKKKNFTARCRFNFQVIINTKKKQINI